ncbi:uncharacterized protein LOC105184246 [Harpegnathos saltator]|uniref:uncharacterized protein LOC105184246 n=1 Tax=Harpegnathos saltator TaxID=610380 RepID=UPI000DBED02B|nr:uncharacterized protein LOC105184246 [Harpegnathos saltator]
MSPFSTVEFPAFRQIFNSFKIKYDEGTLKHLTRYTLTKRIDALYNEHIEVIKNHLKNTKHVCTTTDVWTVPDRRVLGVTTHWLCDKILERKSAVIACKTIKGTHSAEAIAAKLARIYAFFGLSEEKIVATVTDNGSNFIKRFRMFGLSSNAISRNESPSTNYLDTEMEINDLSETNDRNIIETNENNDDDDDDNNNYDHVHDESVVSEEINDEIKIILPRHLRCTSHTLNLIASSDAIKIIKEDYKLKRLHEEAIGECEKLWRKLRSPKNREALKKYLNCALKRPVITR